MVATIAVGCASPRPLFAPNVDVQPVAAPSLLPLGRLRVGVPPGFTRESSETVLTGTEAWTEPLELSPDERWARHLAALPAGAERERFDWGDAGRAVTFMSGNDLLIELMKPYDDHVLWLRREFPEGKLPIAEKLLRELVRVYTPHSRDGFGVEHGAFQRVSQVENARLSLVGPARARLSLIVSSNVVARERAPADIAREVEQLGGTLQVLRERSRTVAGLRGTELVMTLTTPAAVKTLRFEWVHAGAPSSRAPALTLEATGPNEAGPELERGWEQLLGALKLEAPP
ncbi:MAG: hypothetical protein Q8S33_06875 [Myxococcales bacterium]|nr:hypothetical protein [Myxococcales bacterium]